MKKSERTKLHITATAAELFNKQGYAGTSMDEILLASGLSKGALYGHFRSKEEVAIASFQHSVGTIIAKLRERTIVIDKCTDKLKAVVYFYRQHILNPPFKYGCPILNMATETADYHPSLRKTVKAALDHWQERIVYLVSKGKKRGEIKPEANAEKFAIRFISLMEGAILLTQIYKDPNYFKVVSVQLIELIEGLDL